MNVGFFSAYTQLVHSAWVSLQSADQVADQNEIASIGRCNPATGRIEMIGPGTARVRVEVIALPGTSRGERAPTTAS